MPERTAKKLHWAPNDVMLELLEELESQPDRADMRHALVLSRCAAACCGRKERGR